MQNGGLIAEILNNFSEVIYCSSMALPPAKDGEKALVLSRLSGEYFDFSMY